jgi:1,4-alpha-glucan branching enzyme
MKKSSLFSLFLSLFFLEVMAQKVTLDPSISPTLFRYNDQITVTYDVTGTSLASQTDVWIWVWIPNKGDAKSNVNPANSNSTATNPAKCTKSFSSGKTLFTISLRPSDFFSFDISAQTQLGILLKGNDWSNGQTTDFVTNFWDGIFQTKLISPTVQPLFVANGDSIIIKAVTPVAADYALYLNNELIDAQASLVNYKYKLIASDTVKFYTAKIITTANSNSSQVSFTYNIHQESPLLTRPQGIIDGINYNSSDPTKATLCFWAPNKTSVYAIGDFTSWSVDPNYLMNKDGEHFWIEVRGLTAGIEYAFQYLVNDSLRIADPYTDKILEQDDNKIPSATYPNLKTISSKALSTNWYFNHFSVLQTAQTPYLWQTTTYQKPAKENLVIYELLVRDFFDSGHRNFQSLIDTISYFKKLGVNAIELMPIAEFNGEIGWGYNPTSMFAVQKYYGHKNKLKEFVDKCHVSGISVIMDIVMNHQDLPNAYAMLDFDFANGHPKPTNKWFNVSATHPYSVFYDLNHESKFTQKYLDTINYYWMHEFKIDGYRYDLSKGFTQTNSGSNVSFWGNFDQRRINNLTRMADALWANFPDAYIILEHFADNSEETALANYRVNEGKGMMLWENFNYAYNQNTMGYVSGSDISGMYHGNKGWTAPRAVGYMESHDEERLMYKNLQYGNASGNYSAKVESNALQRMKAAAVMFYTIPGPKMLWEFGESGYDKSINTCVSGSVADSCRLSPKPVPWTNYSQDQNRIDLRSYVADLIRLRKNYDLFSLKGVAQMTSGSSTLVQQMILKNSPYTSSPTDSSKMNAVVVANFDVTAQATTISFPHGGTWYDYYNGNTTVTISSTSLAVTLKQGEHHVYTDVKMKTPSLITATEERINADVTLFPIPTQSQLYIESSEGIRNIQTKTITGALVIPIRIDENTWDVSSLATGLYILEIQMESGVVRKKMIKD